MEMVFVLTAMGTAMQIRPVAATTVMITILPSIRVQMIHVKTVSTGIVMDRIALIALIS